MGKTISPINLFYSFTFTKLYSEYRTVPKPKYCSCFTPTPQKNGLDHLESWCHSAVVVLYIRVGYC